MTATFADRCVPFRFDEGSAAFLGDEGAVSSAEVGGVQACVPAAFRYGFQEPLQDWGVVARAFGYAEVEDG